MHAVGNQMCSKSSSTTQGTADQAHQASAKHAGEKLAMAQLQGPGGVPENKSHSLLRLQTGTSTGTCKLLIAIPMLLLACLLTGLLTVLTVSKHGVIHIHIFCQLMMLAISKLSLT